MFVVVHLTALRDCLAPNQAEDEKTGPLVTLKGRADPVNA